MNNHAPSTNISENENYGDLLIKNGTVITVDPDERIIENGAILIRSGRIVKVDNQENMKEAEASTIIDAENGIVMPGLVNAHTHLPMSLFRGFADDLPLMTWLNDYMFKLEAKYINPETVKCGTRLSCAEMLLSGTTTCCDGYFHESAVADALHESGMRAILGHGVIDFPAPGVDDPSLNVEKAREFAIKYRALYPKVTSSIFCHSPYTCSSDTLVKAKKCADDLGLLFQIHVAETKSEMELILQQHSMSPVKYLDSLGILEEKTLLVHAVWIDDEDIEIIRLKGASVAHAPESNMKLASGVAPVHKLLKAKIATGLGTDGSASNNNLDLFTEMDMAAKLHKVKLLDPGVMDAHSILRMATIEGARAIGMDREIGSLEVGKQADIVIIDTNRPHLIPMYNPVSHIVYSVRGDDVRDVIIDGGIVVKDRVIKTMDLGSVVAEAKSLASSFRL